MDGTPVNVDVTAPGAIIALALIFLKVILSIGMLFNGCYKILPQKCTQLFLFLIQNA